MNKYLVLGVFLAIFAAGLAVIFSIEPVSFNELMLSLNGLSPRVLSLLLLPFIAVLYVLVMYLRRRREDRMWKNALKETRAKKQR